MHYAWICLPHCVGIILVCAHLCLQQKKLHMGRSTANKLGKRYYTVSQRVFAGLWGLHNTVLDVFICIVQHALTSKKALFVGNSHSPKIPQESGYWQKRLTEVAISVGPVSKTFRIKVYMKNLPLSWLWWMECCPLFNVFHGSIDILDAEFSFITSFGRLCQYISVLRLSGIWYVNHKTVETTVPQLRHQWKYHA